VSQVLAYVGASVVALWGVAHALPTGRVVAGFADTSADNRLVVAQEWVAEAVTMWFVAALVIGVTVIGRPNETADWVYRASAVLLVVLGALTAATGARTPVVFFKICPVVMVVCAGLLLGASWA